MESAVAPCLTDFEGRILDWFITGDAGMRVVFEAAIEIPDGIRMPENNVTIHQVEAAGFWSGEFVDEEVPGVVAPTFLNIVAPAYYCVPEGMVLDLLFEQRFNYRHGAVGAAIGENEDFGAQISFGDLGKDGLLEERFQGDFDGFLLVMA